MPPHPHHHHSHHGGFRGGWGPDVVVIDPGPAVDCAAIRATDAALTRAGIVGTVPRGLLYPQCYPELAMGDDQVTVIDEMPPMPHPVRSGIRESIRLASGKRLPGTNAYYTNPGANRMRFPFQWGGWPGGQPRSRVAGETRELSGGDLWESGLTPYSLHYPPLQGRGLVGMGGVLDVFGNLSVMEKRAVTVGALGVVAFLAWKHLRGRKRGRRVNPATVKRGRKRLRRRRRVRRR